MKIQNRRDTQYISINFKDLHDNLFVKKRNYPNCTNKKKNCLKYYETKYVEESRSSQ